MIIVTVHGTNDGATSDHGSKWWQIESDFCRDFSQREAFRDFRFHRFHWSGLNSHEARESAAQQLYKQILHFENTKLDYCILSHSHGGNVVQSALKKAFHANNSLDFFKHWYTIATPFFEYKLSGNYFTRLNPAYLVLGFILFSFSLLAAGRYWRVFDALLQNYEGNYDTYYISTAFEAINVPLFLLLSVICIGAFSIVSKIRLYSRKSHYKIWERYRDRITHIWDSNDEAIKALEHVQDIRFRLFRKISFFRYTMLVFGIVFSFWGFLTVLRDGVSENVLAEVLPRNFVYRHVSNYGGMHSYKDFGISKTGQTVMSIDEFGGLTLLDKANNENFRSAMDFRPIIDPITRDSFPRNALYYDIGRPFLSFDYEGKYFAAITQSRDLLLVDLVAKPNEFGYVTYPYTVLKENLGPIDAFSFSNDGKTIATASQDGVVRIYDTDTQQILKTVLTNGFARKIQYSPTSDKISIAEDASIIISGVYDDTYYQLPLPESLGGPSYDIEWGYRSIVLTGRDRNIYNEAGEFLYSFPRASYNPNFVQIGNKVFSRGSASVWAHDSVDRPKTFLALKSKPFFLEISYEDLGPFETCEKRKLEDFSPMQLEGLRDSSKNDLYAGRFYLENESKAELKICFVQTEYAYFVSLISADTGLEVDRRFILLSSRSDEPVDLHPIDSNNFLIILPDGDVISTQISALSENLEFKDEISNESEFPIFWKIYEQVGFEKIAVEELSSGETIQLTLANDVWEYHVPFEFDCFNRSMSNIDVAIFCFRQFIRDNGKISFIGGYNMMLYQFLDTRARPFISRKIDDLVIYVGYFFTGNYVQNRPMLDEVMKFVTRSSFLFLSAISGVIFGVIAGAISFLVVPLLNRVVSHLIREKAYGDDVHGVRVRSITTAFLREDSLDTHNNSPLPTNISEDMKSYVAENLPEAITVIRENLASIIVGLGSDQIDQLIEKNNVWHSLIHTSYFHVPSFRELLFEKFSHNLRTNLE